MSKGEPTRDQIARILYDYFSSERESLWAWLKSHDYNCEVEMRKLIDAGGPGVTVEHDTNSLVYTAYGVGDEESQITIVFPPEVHMEDSVKESIVRNAWRKSFGE